MGWSRSAAEPNRRAGDLQVGGLAPVRRRHRAGPAELLAADLSGLDLVALMVDGIRVADHCCVVALGITLDGTKIPLALAEGATENTTVVTDVLAGLRERGLEVTRPILVVIDGARALRRAVTEVFDHPVIQRCQLHSVPRGRARSAGEVRLVA